MENVVVMGPPGVGKGTQSEQLASTLGVPHLTTGQMLRDEIASGTEIGKTLEHVMSAGEFVADAITSELLRARLRRLEGGFILDGYPRTAGQVVTLDAMLAEQGRSIDVVVLLDAEDSVVSARIAGRGGDARADDREEVVRHRLALYRESTRPVAVVYEERGILIRIDASGSREAVESSILEQIASRSAVQ